jgi:hypothetical protein
MQASEAAGSGSEFLPVTFAEERCRQCGAPMHYYQYDLETAVLLCSSADCLWPLDSADVDALCLPAADPRVLLQRAPVPNAAADEPGSLQDIEHALFQPTPVSSPAPWRAGVQQAPSLPPSMSLGPVSHGHEPSELAALELPPHAQLAPSLPGSTSLGPVSRGLEPSAIAALELPPSVRRNESDFFGGAAGDG